MGTCDIMIFWSLSLLDLLLFPHALLQHQFGPSDSSSHNLQQDSSGPFLATVILSTGSKVEKKPLALSSQQLIL